MEKEIKAVNSYTAPYVDTRIISDVTQDLSLADYYPEVNRIIFVTARAIPEGKFISGNEIDCDGTVAFNVTYLGSDGTIASVPIASQYTQTSTLPDADGIPGEIVCTCEAQSPSCRVTSPRTISLKAHVVTRLFCAQSKEASPGIVDKSGGDVAADKAVTVEENCVERPTVRLYYGAYSGELAGEIDERDCERIVTADAVINVIDARAENARVAVKAEAIITLLCQNPEGVYKISKIKAPFETAVPIEEAETGDGAVASAIVTSIEVIMNDEGLSYELEYDMDAQAAKAETVTICGDAFSTDYESAVETADIEVFAPLKFTNAHLTQTGDLKRHGEAKAGEYVIGTEATAETDNAVVSDGKLKLSGNVIVQSAIRQEDGVVTEDGKIPFTFVCDTPMTEAEALCFAKVDVTDVTARIEGANLYITAELAISISALACTKERALTNLTLDTESKRDRRYAIKIFFPEKDESVWSICKRYGCSRRTLERLNGFTEGQTAAGNAPIIIE